MNFNPVGAHPSGNLGEDPWRIPNYLVSYAQQVAVGRRPTLALLGNYYATIDENGVMILQFTVGRSSPSWLAESVAKPDTKHFDLKVIVVTSVMAENHRESDAM